MHIKAAFFASVAFLSCSCATQSVNRDFQSLFRGDPYGASSNPGEDVNGFLPATVSIKTRTQTFCRDYQFCLVDGRIYYKSMKSRSPDDWRLLTSTGLPHSSKKGFRSASRIEEIVSDAYNLYALSDEGRVYQVSLTSEFGAGGFTWIDKLGWPDKTPLVLNDLVARNRAWSASIRNEHVLWYEDAAGNQHHYGTIGVVSLYFLSEDGREIRFADPGLPSDFSHQVLGPERGSFAAESLSASASTLFVIDDAGNMYTRLADFDTLGYDPMFFKYSYAPASDDTPGSDYWTNYSPWALPAEDWRAQEPIPLRGLAAISSRITILQTGYGNAARELRVAGLSPDGETGYYYKDIFEAEWRFTPVPLSIGPEDYLDDARVASGAGTRGASLEATLRGSLWLDGGMDEELSFRVPDFSVREGSCHLEISLVSEPGEPVALDLYPVDMWTYMKRYDPGLDGTPKLMYFTVGIPDGALDGAPPRLAERVRGLFGPIHLEAFACRGEATEDYLHIELPFGEPGSSYLFLSDSDVVDIDKDLLRRLSLVWSRQVDRYLSDELVLDDVDALTVARRTEIEEVIARNERYRDDIQGELRLFRSYTKSSRLSRWSYSAFDLFATVTQLKKVDYPKFKTVTSHGDEIMDANEKSYRFVADAKEWTYAKLLELLDIRIEEYRRVIDAFDSGALRASLAPGYRETFAGYFDAVRLPNAVAGSSPSLGGGAASLSRFSASPLFPGLVLSVESAEPGREVVVLVELEDSAGRVLRRKRDDLVRDPFTAKSTLHIVSNRTAREAEDASGRVEWDGSTLRVWRGGSVLSRELLFEGTVE